MDSEKNSSEETCKRNWKWPYKDPEVGIERIEIVDGKSEREIQSLLHYSRRLDLMKCRSLES